MRVHIPGFIVLAGLLLCACETAPPPLAFDQSTRASVKRICLVTPGIPERAEVTIMNPIGAGFGVVGNLIEARREAAADSEMAGVLAKAHYDFGAALTAAIAAAARKAGFTVIRDDGQRPPKASASFLPQYPKRGAQVDAYLDVYAPYVGFRAPRSSAAYHPRIELIARLVDTRGATLFQRRLVYGSSAVEDEDAIVVAPDDNVSFRDRAALQGDPSGTARALQSAIDSIAWELARQLM
jgi:hypothetical protein